MLSNNDLLKMAVEITKEYARGGSSGSGSAVIRVLEDVYKKLEELNK